MRYYSLSFLFLVLALVACQKQSSLSHVVTHDDDEEYIIAKASGIDPIYDEQSGFYLVPCNDIFELSNVQSVYQALTESNDRLLPTHKALKFMPQDEATAHSLLTDTTMWVSRIPLGYRPVTQKKSISTPIKNTFNNEIVLGECELKDCTEGEGTTPVFTPLYVRWPVGKAIPDIPFEYMYDIYTPSSGSVTDSLLTAALMPDIQTRGERPDAGNHPAWMAPWGLKIMFYDNRLFAYKKVMNIHVRYMDYYSYYTRTLVTDSNGRVDVPVDVPMSAWVFLEFYTNDFKITENDSSNYSIEFIDTVDNLTEYPYSFVLGSPVTTLEYEYSFKRQVFQAARYYYKGHNDLLDNIDKLKLDNPLRIATYADSLSFYDGEDHYIGEFLGGANPPYIRLCQYTYLSSMIFGTTLHELGHASHYSEMSPNNPVIEARIKESFASFMGWYNVRAYYSSTLTTDSMVHNSCSQGRQDWPDNNYNYTPIYVDLIDDYNQSVEIGSSYVIDTISGVPVTDVLTFAIGPTNWAESTALMQQKVGVLYSAAAFNNLISLY